MSATNYLEGHIRAWLAAATQMPAPPATVYVALFTAAPGEAGGGTEVSGGSYVRQATSWDASDPNANDAVVTFPTATADWGNVTHAALFDADTGGNMLVYAALNESKTISNGDTAEFAVGSMTIAVD